MYVTNAPDGGGSPVRSRLFFPRLFAPPPTSSRPRAPPAGPRPVRPVGSVTAGDDSIDREMIRGRPERLTACSSRVLVSTCSFRLCLAASTSKLTTQGTRSAHRPPRALAVRTSALTVGAHDRSVTVMCAVSSISGCFFCSAISASRISLKLSAPLLSTSHSSNMASNSASVPAMPRT